jgi:hypothetical protein
MKIKYLITLSLILSICSINLAEESDPLPSWNASKSKEAIINFIKQVTNKNSTNFVSPSERIAVFDNDGTLWSEQPMYFQLLFAIDRVKELAPLHPEWKSEEPFASILKGDLKTALKGGEKAILDIVIATHAGMSTKEFEEIVTRWIATAKHPTTKLPYTKMVYKPMLEVLKYLSENGFKNFIVSGGGIEFIRPWAEAVYGIPPENVIGSSVKVEYVIKDNKPALFRQKALNFINDKDTKPVGIHMHIGRHPIAAFGNSDGDLQMLEWTTLGRKIGFGLFVHHTDEMREWSYDRNSSVGKLEVGLEKAKANGWTVVDMKNDWKVIYPD